MAFEWDPINSVQFGGQDTTSFLNDGIELEDHSTGRCDVETSTGKYSCIRLSFTFKKAQCVSINAFNLNSVVMAKF